MALALISFFFSASETAIIGLSKIKLRHLVSKGVKNAASVMRLVKKLDSFIAAILIGNDFVNIAISAIATAMFVYFLGYHLGVILSTVISTFFVLVFCEITPKMLAIKHTQKIALFTAPVMEFFIKIFSPVIWLFTTISNFILKSFGVGTAKRLPLITEEELRLMIEIGKEEGVLTDEERKMLHRIFEFGETKIKDVMIPLKDAVSVSIASTQDELLDILAEEGHARIPVYQDSRDNVVGVIYVRDLLYQLKEKELFVLHDLMQPAYYILGTKRVNELLRDFQSRKIQIAVVVDDKQKALGLVTLEDLVEEIVGELEEVIPEKNHHKNKN
jgi:putative hemolysin